MRIISNWKDYYDSCQAWGMERSIIYVRETREIKLDTKSRVDYYVLNPFYLSFCGKTYAGVFYLYHDKEFNWYKNFFYNLDKLKKFIKDNPNVDFGYYNYSWNKNAIDKHFGEYLAAEDAKCTEMHLEYNSPCFIYDVNAKTTIINPCLKNWEFFRVKDSFTTYIEMMNYVGGVLQNPAKLIPDIDDKTLAEAKGFDKFSFRKDKSKRWLK